MVLEVSLVENVALGFLNDEEYTEWECRSRFRVAVCFMRCCKARRKRGDAVVWWKR